MEFVARVVTFEGFLGFPGELGVILRHKALSVEWIDICPSVTWSYRWWASQGSGDFINGVIIGLKKMPKVSHCIGVGYSMGGRLLLQCLERAPDLFHKIIFISTHPGLSTNEERNTRWQSDRQWIQKLRSGSLFEFIELWEKQEVFAGTRQRGTYSARIGNVTFPSVCPIFDNDHLAYIFERYSLARQSDYRGLLKEISASQVWVAGERDKKFVQIVKELDGSSLCRLIVPRSGHRVHLDRPKILQYLLKRFI
ncbi:MAG: alpha/beta fold hydrolase [Bdellovibrionaceae bacterium]|nr:alpha/beta fold hydrolase [Pseudobdellovibrionaceae bacterium]MDW8189726.1 alpha/beta fold hydrolase [Pseudobdellovibrionaceae bacterium]